MEIRSKLVKILQINNLFNLKHIYLNIVTVIHLAVMYVDFLIKSEVMSFF